MSIINNTDAEKIILDLGKITSKIKMKLTVTINSNSPNFKYQTITSFNYLKSDYLRVSPKPILSIDVSCSDDKKIDSMLLSKFTLSQMISSLEDFLEIFKKEDLFYYDPFDNLMISKTMQENNEKIIPVNNGVILIYPAIVTAENDGGVGKRVYEGCVMCLNDHTKYTYLTYDELKFLLYTLKKTDIDTLTVGLLNTYRLYKNDFNKPKIENKMTAREEDVLEGRGYIFDSKPSELPFL